MSLSNTTDKIGPFIITGLPQVIPVSFPFQAGDELIVYDTGALGTTNDPALTLTLNSDYTVTGGGYDSANTMQTGSITVVSTGANSVLVGDYLVIARNVPINQTTSFQASGPLTIQMVEQALDKQATLSQQVNEVAGRALRFEEWEFNDGVLSRTARAGKLLGFDENGNVSFSSDSSGSGTTYTAGAGLQLNSNQFSVLPDQTFTNLTVTNPIAGDLAGNANTATALQTARNINGIPFDGTTNITVPAAASTLTGTSLASNVVSSSLTSVAAGTIGTMAIQNANGVAITGGTINGATVTGLANGVNPSDAVNLSQLQGVSSGILLRTGVVAATTANITLSAPQTIDGQAVIAGNRVLVKNQTLPAENGIYDVAAGAWVRSSDSNTAGELLVGYTYFVSSGTVNGASTWSINVAPTILNTDPVGFVQFSAAQAYSAGTGLTLAGNVFSISPTQSGLTITSSAFNGTIGATTPSSAAFTTQTTTGNSFMANLVIKANQLNEQATNGTASVNINYDGYAGGTTQFRDFSVYDGKNNSILSVTGSTRAVAGSGDYTITKSAPLFITSDSGSADKQRFGAFGPYQTAYMAQNLSYNGSWNLDNTGLLGGVLAINGTSMVYYQATAGANPRTVTPYLYAGSSGLTIVGGISQTGIFNVRTYGALGDGSTNDTSAIATAKAAAVTAHGVLYFPTGTYVTDLITVTGAVGLTICGDGMGVSVIKARTPSQVLNVSTSNHINVRHLTFDGNCTVRTAGQQAVILDASQSSFCDCEIINAGEYSFLAGSGAAITDLIVSRNLIRNGYADGINIQNVSRFTVSANVVDGADDDLIAIGYNGSGIASDGTVTGNYLRARSDLATTWGRGIWVGRASQVNITGNYITNTKQSGIFISSEGVSRCNRLLIEANEVYACARNSGHAVEINGISDSDLIGNKVVDPVQGNCMEVADWSNLTIAGGVLTQSTNVFCRGIHANESSGTFTTTNWQNLVIKDVTIRMDAPSTNSCVYLVPHSSITMTIGGVVNVTGKQATAGDYITVSTARMATQWKLGNNVTLTSNTVNPSSSAGVYTVFNNN